MTWKETYSTQSNENECIVSLKMNSIHGFNFVMLDATGLFKRKWELGMLTVGCCNICFFSTETSEF